MDFICFAARLKCYYEGGVGLQKTLNHAGPSGKRPSGMSRPGDSDSDDDDDDDDEDDDDGGDEDVEGEEENGHFEEDVEEEEVGVVAGRSGSGDMGGGVAAGSGEAAAEQLVAPETAEVCTSGVGEGVESVENGQCAVADVSQVDNGIDNGIAEGGGLTTAGKGTVSEEAVGKGAGSESDDAAAAAVALAGTGVAAAAAAAATGPDVGDDVREGESGSDESKASAPDDRVAAAAAADDDGAEIAGVVAGGGKAVDRPHGTLSRALQQEARENENAAPAAATAANSELLSPASQASGRCSAARPAGEGPPQAALDFISVSSVSAAISAAVMAVTTPVDGDEPKSRRANPFPTE